MGDGGGAGGNAGDDPGDGLDLIDVVSKLSDVESEDDV